MNKIFGIAALAACAGIANASLTAGSIAFTGWNADASDDLAFVALDPIAAGTVIYFGDNEYVSGSFNTGESYTSWTAPAGGVAAGSVITFSNFTLGTVANIGTLAPVTVSGSTNRGVATSGETVYAYLGTSATAPTTFLAAISNDAFAAGGLAGTGLTAGVNAFATTNGADAQAYTGSRSNQSSFAAYLSQVNNIANWGPAGDGSGDQSGTVLPFDTTAFVIPGPGAIALAGIGGLLAARRRRA
jgi:hypothetical protein